jgi:predicted DNA-binding antitoxin AbrB/MazE fold protein
MEKVFQAVYKDGVLRPDEPLPLEEMQRVSVTINVSPAADSDVAGYFTPEEWAAAALDPISWDDVKRALSGISGSLSEVVIAQRQER